MALNDGLGALPIKAERCLSFLLQQTLQSWCPTASSRLCCSSITRASVETVFSCLCLDVVSARLGRAGKVNVLVCLIALPSSSLFRVCFWVLMTLEKAKCLESLFFSSPWCWVTFIPCLTAWETSVSYEILKFIPSYLSTCSFFYWIGVYFCTHFSFSSLTEKGKIWFGWKRPLGASASVKCHFLVPVCLLTQQCERHLGGELCLCSGFQGLERYCPCCCCSRLESQKGLG